MKTIITRLGLATLTIVFYSSTLLAQKISMDERRYRKIDTNNNGSVSIEEFIAEKRKKPISQEKLIKQYNKIDSNKNRAITLEEFVADKKRKRAKIKALANLEMTFKRIDTDYSRSISLKEYLISESKSEKLKSEIENDYIQMDIDKNNNISLREFISESPKLNTKKENLINKSTVKKVVNN